MRTIEITRVNICDIKTIDGKRVLQVHGKGKTDKSGYVVLSDKCYQAISKYLDTRKSKLINEPLFVSKANRNSNERLTTHSIRVIVKKYAKKAGITKRIHPHLFRHQILTYLTSKGILDAKIQLISGHKTLSSLGIYQDLSLEEFEKEYDE